MWAAHPQVRRRRHAGLGIPVGKAPDGAVLQRAAASCLSTAPAAGEPLVAAAEKHPASALPQESGQVPPMHPSRSQARAWDLAGVSGSWVSCCSELVSQPLWCQRSRPSPVKALR